MAVCTHSLAECFSALTSLPVRPRIQPGTASNLIEESIDKHASLVDLGADDYRQAMAGLAKAGLSGGVTYDALLLAAARKTRANVLLTMNPRDFQRLLPPDSVAVTTPAEFQKTLPRRSR